MPHVDLVQLEGGEEQRCQLVTKDLLRRDFTVNAMAGRLVRLEEGAVNLDLLDPCGGREDLQARLLRPVSDSALADDPVRMLRCFRLAAGLNFRIAPEALEAIRRDCCLISESAPERTREELLLLLDVTPCLGQLELALETGLLYEIIPELRTMEGVAQNGYHHLEILEHTLETLEHLEGMLRDEDGGGKALVDAELMQRARELLATHVHPGITRRALLKLAVLLHDVGKPGTRTTEADGRTRFIGHNLLGAEIAREVGRRLRLGKRPTEMIAKMVREHLRPGLLDSQPSATDRAINRFFNQMGDLTEEVLLLELADRMATRGPLAKRAPAEKHARFIESLLSTHWARTGEDRPPRLVDGHEVMARFNIPPGPLVGRLLNIVNEAQEEEKIATKEEAFALLDEVLPSLAENSEGGRA